MNWNSFDFFPVMGIKLNQENTLPLDFSSKNKALETVDLTDTAMFSQYVFSQLEKAGKTFGTGGYLENRAIYRRSEVFGNTSEERRTIHLGVDIWTQAGAPVFVPWPGKVHSFRDNQGFGDYGPTIILQHEIEGKTLHTLYGHLQRTDLKTLQIGQEFQAGKLLCHIGPYPENGDWPAHLHFQLIWDMGEYQGDYPGVAAIKDLKYYQANCPDPLGILGF